jgi:ABC-type transport system involved in multi-copper enzyme maturation permease subunit
MNKFKTLLIKDFHTNKKTLLMPFWITAGFYALMIIGLIIAYFRGEIPMDFFRIDGVPAFPALNYMSNLAMASMPGTLCLIFTIMLAQGALNEDIRRNYELFHRSQPVSLWKRVTSKFTISVLGSWVVFFAIVLFNFILTNIVLAIIGQFHFSSAFSGMLQAGVATLRYAILIGSIAYFFSSVFKDKAFLKGAALILGIQVLFGIMNVWFKWSLPLPASFLLSLFRVDINMMGAESATEISNFINQRWNEVLWNMKVVWQLLFSGAMFIVGTLIYNFKEVK